MFIAGGISDEISLLYISLMLFTFNYYPSVARTRKIESSQQKLRKRQT